MKPRNLHNILIVDDDDIVRKVLYRQLTKAGYQVIRAQNGMDALTKLECFEVDLLIADHVMPEMSGVDLLKMARRHYPLVTRVLLTGHADLETAMESINSGGVFRLMVKPWQCDELLRTVQVALAKHKRSAEATRALKSTQRRRNFTEAMAQRFPGLLDVQRDESGCVILS